MEEMKIRENLYNKMQQEYNDFIDNLKQQPPEKIIEGAYQKVIKEEILGDFYPEYKHYDIDKIKALGKTKEPLEELYQGWMNCDAGIHQVLEDSIYDTLDEIEKVQKQKQKAQER